MIDYCRDPRAASNPRVPPRLVPIFPLAPDGGSTESISPQKKPLNDSIPDANFLPVDMGFQAKLVGGSSQRIHQLVPKVACPSRALASEEKQQGLLPKMAQTQKETKGSQKPSLANSYPVHLSWFNMLSAGPLVSSSFWRFGQDPVKKKPPCCHQPWTIPAAWQKM